MPGLGKWSFSKSTHQQKKGGTVIPSLPPPQNIFLKTIPLLGTYTQAQLKEALKYRVDNGLSGGLGYDFFTTIGKSLKTGAIKMVAPSVSKLTGVSVDKVKAQLQKTHINGGKIAGNLLKKKDKKGNTVIPVVDVQDPAPSDISDGTPATNEDKPYMAGKLPAYALPVAGGLLVLIAVGIYKSRS